MTEDLLVLANRKQHDIKQVEEQLKKVQEMTDDSYNISLYNAELGSVALNNAIKTQVLALVESELKEWLEELKDDFRML